jgi:acetyl esterase/lipase
VQSVALTSALGAASWPADVLLPGFRYPPRVPVAAMITDCLAAYRWLLEQPDPAGIVLSGDSSGGNLAFATALAARDEGLPMPAALVGMSAWLDLAYEPPPGAPRDALVPLSLSRRIARLCFEDDAPAAALRPLDREVSGLPPVLLQAGVHDPMRDGNERMQRHLTAAGVPCELQLWPGKVHAFQVFGRVLPEARAAVREVGRFARASAVAREKST